MIFFPNGVGGAVALNFDFLPLRIGSSHAVTDIILSLSPPLSQSVKGSERKREREKGFLAIKLTGKLCASPLSRLDPIQENLSLLQPIRSFVVVRSAHELFSAV